MADTDVQSSDVDTLRPAGGGGCSVLVNIRGLIYVLGLVWPMMVWGKGGGSFMVVDMHYK